MLTRFSYSRRALVLGRDRRDALGAIERLAAGEEPAGARRARRRRSGEGVPAQEVDVIELERGQPGEQLVGGREAVGGQLLDGGARTGGWGRAVDFDDPRTPAT